MQNINTILVRERYLKASEQMVVKGRLIPERTGKHDYSAFQHTKIEQRSAANLLSLNQDTVLLLLMLAGIQTPGGHFHLPHSP